MKLKQLFESKHIGILYHYCPAKVFENIIDDNLILKDMLKRGTISFSRFGYGLSRFGECRFVLDGTKMSNKYKIVPDSLARLPDTGQKYKGIDGKYRYKLPHELQGEERIYNKPNIDIKPFLLAIQINSTDFFYKDDLERFTYKIGKITKAPFQINNSGKWNPYK